MGRRAGGFTFLELLIAISLFVVGMVSVLQIFPLNRRYLAQSSATTQAAFLAQEEVEQIHAVSYDNQSVGSSPAYEARHALAPYDGDASTALFERQTVINYVDPAASYAVTATDTGFKRVTVSVFWQENGNTRQYDLSTFTYDK